jgi:tetratricopeptide (TPR) repeat protein
MRLCIALFCAALCALAPAAAPAQEGDAPAEEQIEENLDDEAPQKEVPRKPTDPVKVSSKAAPPKGASPKAVVPKDVTPQDALPKSSQPKADPPTETPGKDPPREGQIVLPRDASKSTPKDKDRQPAPAAKDVPKAAAFALEPARAANVVTEEDLKNAIEARARALRSGDQTVADAELQTMMDVRQQLRARNVVVASASLIHEASEALSIGRLDRAIDLAEAASKLSPDLPAGHWLRFRLYLKRNWAQFDKISASLADLFSAKVGCFRNLVVLISNTLGILSLAVLATIIGFTLIQAFKYLRYSAHDLVRVLPSWFGAGEGVMLLIIAIATPLVFGFGVAPSLVIALGVIYAYQTFEERTLSKWAMSILALAPGLIFISAPLVTFHGSIADALDSASTEAFATDAEERLLRYEHGAGSNDIQASLVLARRYRMRGDLASAENEYRKALLAQPNNTVARNNLGTLLYLEGRDEQAKATFQVAANASEYAEPFLNLASLLVDSSNFDEANGAIERARRVNRDLTELYTKFDSTVPTAKKLFDAEIGGTLWARLLDAETDQRLSVTAEVWHFLGGETPWFAMPFVVLLIAAAAIALGRKGDQMNLSVACPKCGIPAERDAPARYCEQCQSIFLKGIAVEPVLRLEKETDVRNYQRRRRWVERGLSVLAGGGHMFGERPWLGAGLLFLFCLLLANMLWSEGLIVHPWSLGREASASLPQLLSCGFGALALIGLSIRQAFR